MSVLVLLISAGGLVAGGFLVAFIWAVRAGQFDDIGTPPVRMLVDELDAPLRSHSFDRGAHDESRC